MSANSYNYGYSNTPGNKKDDSDWLSWVIIVALFATGLWPVGLIMLFVKLSDKGGKKKQKEQFPPLRTETPAQAQARQAREAAAQSHTTASAASEQARERGRAAAERAREKARQTAQQTPPQESRAKTAAKKMTKTPAMKSSTATLMKIGGIALMVYGTLRIFSQMGGFFVDADWVRYYLWDTLRVAAFALAGSVLLVKGLSMDRQAKRFQKYLAIIGELEAMPIQQLSRKLGYSERLVEKDLLKMIDKNFFGTSAYLNMELGYFFRSSEADNQFSRQQQAARQPETPQEAEQGYSGILRGIRRANDRIADPVLSAKIQRLEQITAKIFRAVEEDPKKRGRIDTFLNYYLPTTQKLLDSYAEFESTGIEGENLRQAKERIEATMDSIVAGFEHQLDELYRADAMDVDSDIRVMETMLGRDTASAAKDFGLGQTAKPKASGTVDVDFGGAAAQQKED